MGWVRSGLMGKLMSSKKTRELRKDQGARKLLQSRHGDRGYSGLTAPGRSWGED